MIGGKIGLDVYDLKGAPDQSNESSILTVPLWDWEGSSRYSTPVVDES